MENKAEVTFVTGLATWGFLNGVINVSFTTAQFLPEVDDDGTTKVVTADIISANLRFDLNVAQLLRDALDKIIEEQTKPKVTN